MSTFNNLLDLCGNKTNCQPETYPEPDEMQKRAIANDENVPESCFEKIKWSAVPFTVFGGLRTQIFEFTFKT